MSLAASIQFILLQILCVAMVYASTGKNMIFYGIRKILYAWAARGKSDCHTAPQWKKKLLKPILDCPVCMSPWYGILIWMSCGNQVCWDMVVHCLAGGGCTWILTRLIDYEL